MRKKSVSMLCVIIALATMLSTFSIGIRAYSNVSNAPSISDFSQSVSSIKIEWEYEGEKSHSFLVYRSDTGKKGTWTKLTTTKPGARSYVDNTVEPYKAYYYTVKAYKYYPEKNIKFISDMSNVWCVRADFVRPDFKSVGNGGYGIILKWDTDVDMSGVAIYRSMSGKSGTWKKYKMVRNADTYTDSNVTIGETYYYCYKIFKTINGKNYYSESSKAYKRTILDVTTPENLSVVAQDNGVKLEYEKSKGTIGYVIYRSTTGKKGTWSRIKVTKSNNVLSFVDKTAREGKTYYYTVKSYKELNGVVYYSKPANSVKILYDTDLPSMNFSETSVTFKSFYEEIDVSFTMDNYKIDDYIRIFIDGTEISDELVNDEEKLIKFLEEADFFFYINEDESSENRIALKIIRLDQGGGTLRFQYSENPSVFAELKVNCPKLDIDEDYHTMVTLACSGLEKVNDARVLLKKGYDDQTNSVTDAAKIEEARQLLISAETDLLGAKQYYEKYYEEYSDEKIFMEEYTIVEQFAGTANTSIKMLNGDPIGGTYPIENVIGNIEGHMDYHDVKSYFDVWN